MSEGVSDVLDVGEVVVVGVLVRVPSALDAGKAAVQGVVE